MRAARGKGVNHSACPGLPCAPHPAHRCMAVTIKSLNCESFTVFYQNIISTRLSPEHVVHTRDMHVED